METIEIMQEALLLTFSSWWVYLLFGMLFGSFLNVVINRIPAGQSIVYPPSACPYCKTPIKWYDNIPVISWLLLRARCRSCHAPISVQYPLVEAAAGIMATFLYLSTGNTLRLIIILPLGYILMAIAVVDWKTYSIPSKLQYSLLFTAVLAIVLNFINPLVLNISLLQSILGAALGFIILWLIQFVGRAFYKQEAMGGGDLWLLCFGGLLIGPYGVFWAFILGAIIAIVAYFIPAILKIMKKKAEISELETNALNFYNLLNDDAKNDLSLTMLKMQIEFQRKNADLNKIKQSVFNEISLNNQNRKYNLEAFFRFLAIEDEDLAVKALKNFQPEDFGDTAKQQIKKLLATDLLGYGTFLDNLHLLKKYAIKHSLNSLLDILNDKNEFQISEAIPVLTSIEKKLADLSDISEKTTLLLECNRLYQYSGYTSEQSTIAAKIQELLPNLSTAVQCDVVSELAFVYYTDLYYKNYKLELITLKNSVQADKTINLKTVWNLYNLVLYRQCFFKQKLAFGPYLAMGILLAYLYGAKISDWYLNFIEELIIK